MDTDQLAFELRLEEGRHDNGCPSPRGIVALLLADARERLEAQSEELQRIEDAAPLMPLFQALSWLAKGYTHDDPLGGFAVEARPSLEFAHRHGAELVAAWKSVRHALGLKIEPSDQDGERD